MTVAVQMQFVDLLLFQLQSTGQWTAIKLPSAARDSNALKTGVTMMFLEFAYAMSDPTGQRSSEVVLFD
jgi:hypothetical protein